MEAVDMQELKRLAIDEKIVKKRAFALYKKHITGRGYAWPVGCTMPDDAQAAVAEGMREAYALAAAEIESLRKQLEEANEARHFNARMCVQLQSELTALRSSREADIERAIRLACNEYRTQAMAYPGANVDRVLPAVLAQLKEQGK